MKLADPKTWNIFKKHESAYASRGFLNTRFVTNDLTLSYSTYSSVHYPTNNSEISGRLMVGLCLVALVVFNIDALQAVPLDTLREPMKAMKKEVWSYMYVVKVAAALVGGVMSVVQQNLMPMGVGGGIAAGIHFFDGVIGDGAAALIG